MLSNCASVRRGLLNIVTTLLITKLLALVTFYGMIGWPGKQVEGRDYDLICHVRPIAKYVKELRKRPKKFSVPVKVSNTEIRKRKPSFFSSVNIITVLRVKNAHDSTCTSPVHRRCVVVDPICSGHLKCGYDRPSARPKCNTSFGLQLVQQGQSS